MLWKCRIFTLINVVWKLVSPQCILKLILAPFLYEYQQVDKTKPLLERFQASHSLLCTLLVVPVSVELPSLDCLPGATWSVINGKCVTTIYWLFCSPCSGLQKMERNAARTKWCFPVMQGQPSLPTTAPASLGTQSF